jgi:hypothetical protein
MPSQADEQVAIFREILKWTRFAGMREAKNTLATALDTEQKKLVYHLSDGSRGTVEIAKLAGIGSNATVAGFWRDWFGLGLGQMMPVKGGARFQRSFDLADFGLEPGPMKEQK